MLELSRSGKFKKDYIRCMKRGYDTDKLEEIVDILRIPEELPLKNKDHILVGNYAGCRECHIAPDWLLIYRQTETELILDRTGTHSDLF